jgi:hypothetical protein
MATRSKLDKQLDAIAEQFKPRIKRAFLAAIRDIKSRAILQAIIEAIEVGDLEAAFRATGLSVAAMRPITAMIEQEFEAGGVTVANSAPKGITDSMGNRTVFLFDVRNSQAEAWLRDHSSNLVTRITEETKTNIREIVQAGMEAGRNPRSTALDIIGRINPDTKRREGGVVGLTEPQTRWVMNARRDLAQLDPHYFTREARDKRFDSIVRKAIAAGKPLSQEKVNAIIDRYSDNLLQQRGETIARTESIHALNKAADEAFRQAIDQGTLAPNAVFKIWDSAGDARTRSTHLMMEGQRVQLDEAFKSPYGARLMFPGDTSLGAPGSEVINCRCRVRHDVDWLADIDDDVPPAPIPIKPVETPQMRNARLEAEQRDYVLSNGRTENIEYLSAVDTVTGEIFGRNSGTKGNVTFTAEFMAAIADKNRNIVAHHNHPSSSSFSGQDLFVLTESPGLRGLWAHGHNGTSYYAESARKVITEKVINNAMIDLNRSINAELRATGETAATINAIGMNHLVSVYLLRRGWLKTYRAEGSETLNAAQPLIDRIMKRLGI